MKFDIIHDLPGRMRIRCRLVRIAPDYRIELDRWVECHDELLSATFSARTGNLLVMYARTVTRESVLAMLGDLHLFGVAIVAKQGKEKSVVVASAAMQACQKDIVSAVMKAILPKPLLRLLSGLKAGVGIARVFQALCRGDVAAFLGQAARFAVLMLLSGSPAMRVVLVTVLNIATSSRIGAVSRHGYAAGSTRGALPGGCHSRPLLPAPDTGNVAI